MSCNQPYFQALLGAVKDTWAKPLVQNKYSNITWFAYTSCDANHPKPHVNFENHMIYVDCPDDLHHSYEKTKRAYNMIKDIIDFDYVIRTNTSVYVNLDLMLERVNSLDDDSVMGNWYSWRCPENKDISFFLLVGFFYGMCKEYFEYGLSANNEHIKCKNGDVFYTNDDVIFSKRLTECIGERYNNPVGINPTSMITIYKPFDEKDDRSKIPELQKGNNFNISFNPDCVNDDIMVRYRCFYQDEKRIEKGHEIEHIYELHNALNK